MSTHTYTSLTYVYEPTYYNILNTDLDIRLWLCYDWFIKLAKLVMNIDWIETNLINYLGYPYLFGIPVLGIFDI